MLFTKQPPLAPPIRVPTQGGEGDSVYWKQAARAELAEKAESQKLELKQLRLALKKTTDAIKGTGFNALFPPAVKKNRHSL
jgi:hypothetical protein